MKTLILMFYINLMIGCYQKNLGPKGSVVQIGNKGYWKVSDYKVKGKPTDFATISDRILLQTRQEVMQTDSIKQPIYRKGTGYIVFSYFNEALDTASTTRAIEYDHAYNQKSEQSRFWYRINQDSGFLAILNVKADNRNTTRIELSNIIASETYKPELDSLRFIYKPTTKFR